MPNFKNSKDELFWLDNTKDALNFLSSDCVEISDLEAEKLAKNNQKKYFDSLHYTAKRQREYPPMSDYLDGIVKGDTAQVNAYIAACLAVKAKYPKV